MKYSKIILSGKRCTGKSTLFWNLQKAINWPTFSVSQYLRDYIRTYHFSPLDVQAKSQEITDDIDSRIQSLLDSPNQVIIESRVFHQLRQPIPNTLKLLLTATDEIRVKRSAAREQTSLEKAQKRLIKKENKWIEKMGQLYGFTDLFNPDYYDLVINTDPLTPQQVLQQVVNKLTQST